MLVFRLLAYGILLFPSLVHSLFLTWKKMRRWRSKKACQGFIRRHPLAFQDIVPSTLSIYPVAGGVSNANQIWRCQRLSGGEHHYFVKAFVLAGSFWAKHLSVVTPFPYVYGEKTHERFTVDMVSRAQLAEKGIPVPKLIAFDAVEKIMVTEYVDGQNVDMILMRISSHGSISESDIQIFSECGAGLARIHNAGFSLIDTQPVNCIWQETEGRVYFTDLEFCTRDDKRVWDVGFFLCFLALRLQGEIKKEVSRIFLTSYRRERNLDFTGLMEVGRQLKEYLPVFETILDLRQYTPEELFQELFLR